LKSCTCVETSPTAPVKRSIHMKANDPC
jgi:hypothetical protein